MANSEARGTLVQTLQAAYSGELAAALAYGGHWRSLPPGPDRDRVRDIEREEWDHRARVGGMLRELGAGPRRVRELRAWVTGNLLALLCRVAGWFLPMYGAGRLESRNVGEYERAARDAAKSSLG